MRKCRNQLHLSKSKHCMLNICLKLKSVISCSVFLCFLVYLYFKSWLPGLVNFRDGENKIYSNYHLECLSLLQHRRPTVHICFSSIFIQLLVTPWLADHSFFGM